MNNKISKTKQYKFIWPKIGASEEVAVLKQLRTTVSIYGGGGIFEKFEKKFANYHDRKFALLCNSGTTAIHSMFVAAGLKKGDEVICPAYTFFATVTPLFFTGAKPILCDCDENGNINPDEIIKKITSKTKAVVVTHMWGVPAQMEAISKICHKHKILLLEDCSHAHGAKYNNKIVGSFGDISAWSLQGAKLITGGEGGILTTNNRKFYEKALLLGHYNKRCWNEINLKSDVYKYSHTGMGLKYRAHPLAISLAYEIFQKFGQSSRFRNKYARSLIKNLQGLDGVSFPPAYFDKNISPSWYALTFFINDQKKIKLDRMHSLGLLDIDSPDSTKPLNLLPLFQSPEYLFPDYASNNLKFSYKIGDFPMAEKIYKNIVKMPVGVDKEDDFLVDVYLKGIKKVLA